ncbi:unnamed protein product, partial [Didymodactylos carnosus]
QGRHYLDTSDEEIILEEILETTDINHYPTLIERWGDKPTYRTEGELKIEELVEFEETEPTISEEIVYELVYEKNKLRSCRQLDRSRSESRNFRKIRKRRTKRKRKPGEDSMTTDTDGNLSGTVSESSSRQSSAGRYRDESSYYQHLFSSPDRSNLLNINDYSGQLTPTASTIDSNITYSRPPTDTTEKRRYVDGTYDVRKTLINEDTHYPHETRSRNEANNRNNLNSIISTSTITDSNLNLIKNEEPISSISTSINSKKNYISEIERSSTQPSLQPAKYVQTRTITSFTQPYISQIQINESDSKTQPHSTSIDDKQGGSFVSRVFSSGERANVVTESEIVDQKAYDLLEQMKTIQNKIDNITNDIENEDDILSVDGDEITDNEDFGPLPIITKEHGVTKITLSASNEDLSEQFVENESSNQIDRIANELVSKATNDALFGTHHRPETIASHQIPVNVDEVLPSATWDDLVGITSVTHNLEEPATKEQPVDIIPKSIGETEVTQATVTSKWDDLHTDRPKNETSGKAPVEIKFDQPKRSDIKLQPKTKTLRNSSVVSGGKQPNEDESFNQSGLLDALKDAILNVGETVQTTIKTSLPSLIIEQEGENKGEIKLSNKIVQQTISDDSSIQRSLLKNVQKSLKDTASSATEQNLISDTASSTQSKSIIEKQQQLTKDATNIDETIDSNGKKSTVTNIQTANLDSTNKLPLENKQVVEQTQLSPIKSDTTDAIKGRQEAIIDKLRQTDDQTSSPQKASSRTDDEKPLQSLSLTQEKVFINDKPTLMRASSDTTDEVKDEHETIIDKLRQKASDTAQKVIDSIPSLTSTKQPSTDDSTTQIETSSEPSQPEPSLFDNVRQAVIAPLTTASETIQKVVGGLRPTSDTDEKTAAPQTLLQQTEDLKAEPKIDGLYEIVNSINNTIDEVKSRKPVTQVEQEPVSSDTTDEVKDEHETIIDKLRQKASDTAQKMIDSIPSLTSTKQLSSAEASIPSDSITQEEEKNVQELGIFSIKQQESGPSFERSLITAEIDSRYDSLIEHIESLRKPVGENETSIVRSEIPASKSHLLSTVEVSHRYDSLIERIDGLEEATAKSLKGTERRDQLDEVQNSSNEIIMGEQLQVKPTIETEQLPIYNDDISTDLMQQERLMDGSIPVENTSGSASQQNVSILTIAKEEKPNDQHESILDKLKQAVNDTAQKVIDNIPSFHTSTNQEQTILQNDAKTAHLELKTPIEQDDQS